ncbi:MAG: glutamate formimidoyltransferase [Sphingobacteriaceae bacterium]|nr:MAG: glutamate formimidoyltransferase [Sphingobacteriaceae bacterium]
MKRIIECVPNFSEGIDETIINAIAHEIAGVTSVKLLNVDPGKSANRTVMTFAGEPQGVIEAAYLAIKKAGELIDMRTQTGEHPRMGATDVCPLIPISNITIEETVVYANRLAKRVGEELGVPVYLYEYSQPDKNRSNLSIIREGEYEGFFTKIKQPGWQPDFGPAEMNAKSGATVIGARDLLVAYNITLNTKSVKIAHQIAQDVRESGRMERDADGNKKQIPGTLKKVKAIGWYMEQYGKAQVSMNLTDINITPFHIAFEEVCNKAAAYNVKVTGSELIGMIPLKAMLDAGKYFSGKQLLSINVIESELIETAIKYMGLDELSPFEPYKRIIEYQL